jgi:RimJ/RimL family protein N-acetyltransferase
MTLRDAGEADLESIRRWRDHPKVRSASIFVDPITPEMHAAWWRRVCTDPGRRALVFERSGRDCGVVTIVDHDPDAATAEWGFFLDVDGLGDELLPSWMQLEREAVEYGRDTLKLVAMGGRTLAWNEPVLALHRRFGFREVAQRCYTTTIEGVGQRVIWTELDFRDGRGTS